MSREQRLLTERNIWMATTRPDGRPHLVPIWFVWHAGAFYIVTGRRSVKARNLAANPSVAVALEDGVTPIVADCRASMVARPYPSEIAAAFKSKYGWEIETDHEYDGMFELRPLRWTMGG